MKRMFATVAMCLMTACSVGTDANPEGEEQLGTSREDLTIIPINMCAFRPWRSCTVDSQCDAGEMCWFNVCRINPRITRCESDTVSRNKAGDREDCGGYRCNPATGKCFTQCTDGGQCSTGRCNAGTGKCAAETDANSPLSTKLPLPGVAPDRETSTSCATTTCSVDANCGDTFKFMCKNGRCLANVPHCTPDRTGQVNWYGVSTCSPNMCSDIDGQCLTTCYNSVHCQGGTRCYMTSGVCGF